MVRRTHDYGDGGPVSNYQPKFKKAYLDEVAANEVSAKAKAAQEEAAAQRHLRTIKERNTTDRRASMKAAAQTTPTRDSTNAAQKYSDRRQPPKPDMAKTHSTVRTGPTGAVTKGDAVVDALGLGKRTAVRTGARALAGRAVGAALGPAGTAGLVGYEAGKALNNKFKISDKIVDAVSPKYDPNRKEKSK